MLPGHVCSVVRCKQGLSYCGLEARFCFLINLVSFISSKHCVLIKNRKMVDFYFTVGPNNNNKETTITQSIIPGKYASDELLKFLNFNSLKINLCPIIPLSFVFSIDNFCPVLLLMLLGRQVLFNHSLLRIIQIYEV